MRKVLIFTYHYNRDDFIRYQAKTFSKFLDCDYHYVVFNDAQQGKLDTLYNKPSFDLIKSTCDELGIEHIPIPQNIHGTTEPCTFRHMDCINWSLRNYPVDNYEYIWFCDSDLFLMAPIDIDEFMGSYEFAAMPYFINDIKLYRPQIVIYKSHLHPIITKYDMSPTVIDGQYTDGCGGLYYMFKENPQISYRPIRTSWCKHCGDYDVTFETEVNTLSQRKEVQKDMKEKGYHNLIYTYKNGSTTETLEEQKDFLKHCNLPKPLEKFTLAHFELARSGVSNNSNSGMWDWRGGFMEGTTFYHYSEGSNWDKKPDDYHLRRSKILGELVTDLTSTIIQQPQNRLKVAVLICSHFECMDNFLIQTQHLFNPEIDYHFYIYTNKRYAPQVMLLPNVKMVQYIEDSVEDILREERIRQIPNCSNIFQYYNLQKCFQLLEQSGNKYDLVYRIRPDIWKDTYQITKDGQKIWTMKRDMREPFWTPNSVEEIPKDTIFAKSDQFYAGNMESMRKVSNLANYLEEYYFGVHNDTRYLPINYRVLSQCDMNSCRFDMLNYPSNIISSEILERFVKVKPGNLTDKETTSPEWKKYLAEKDLLKLEIIKNLELLEGIKATSQTVTSSSGSFGRHFRGEKSFTHYVTSVCNLVIKELPNIRNTG